MLLVGHMKSFSFRTCASMTEVHNGSCWQIWVFRDRTSTVVVSKFQVRTCWGSHADWEICTVHIRLKQAHRVILRSLRSEVFQCKAKKVILPLYKSIVRPHFDYCVQAWRPHYRKDIEKLEKVQKRATRMVEGLGEYSYEDRLGSWGSLLLRQDFRGLTYRGLQDFERFWELGPGPG